MSFAAAGNWFEYRTWYYIGLDDCLGSSGRCLIPARWQVTRATYRLPRNSTVLLCGRLEHVLICRRRRRSSAAGDTESRGSVWQDFITPQGVLGEPQADRGHHRLDVHLHRGSPTPNAAPATSCHLIHSQFFNAMPCGAEQSNYVFLGLLQIISNFHLWLNTLSNFLFWFSWLLLWFPASFGSNWWPICSLHDRGPVGEQLDGGEDNAGRHPPTIVTQTHLTPHRPPLKPSWAEWEKESPKRVEHFKSKSHTKSLPSCWGDDRADFYTQEWHHCQQIDPAKLPTWGTIWTLCKQRW